MNNIFIYTLKISYTEKYFSPIIIQNQLEMLQSKDVKSQLEDEKFSIRVARSSNEVIASFIVDEYVMELSVKMPGNFPLLQAEFGTLERMGTTEVTDLKWAKLPVQTVVNSQVLSYLLNQMCKTYYLFIYFSFLCRMVIWKLH